MYNNQQVLIFGCGDLGVRIAQVLSPQGYTVTGVRRRAQEDLPCLQYLQGDMQDATFRQHLFERLWDVIIITMTPSERSDQGYRKAYVETCQQLVDGLRHHQQQPRLIMFVSSTAVYGQMDGSWVDETSETQPDSFSGKRLLEAEQVVQNSGFPCVIARLSGIYGPGRNRLIEQVRSGRASSSAHFTNRIHADDAAAAIAHFVINPPQHRTYLVTDSHPAPMLEVVTWLAEQMGVKNFLSDSAVNERGNKCCTNQRLLNEGFQLRFPSYRDGYPALFCHNGEL